MCAALGAAVWLHVVRVCYAGEAFTDILVPNDVRVDKENKTFISEFYALWPVHLEVVPITKDVEGWEPASFHQALAREGLSGWHRFQNDILPGLQDDHPLAVQASSSPRGTMKSFLEWQKKALFRKR